MGRAVHLFHLTITVIDPHWTASYMYITLVQPNELEMLTDVQIRPLG